MNIVLFEVTIDVLCGDYAAAKCPIMCFFTCNHVLDLRSQYLLNQVLLWETQM